MKEKITSRHTYRLCCATCPGTPRVAHHCWAKIGNVGRRAPSSRVSYPQPARPYRINPVPYSSRCRYRRLPWQLSAGRPYPLHRSPCIEGRQDSLRLTNRVCSSIVGCRGMRTTRRRSPRCTPLRVMRPPSPLRRQDVPARSSRLGLESARLLCVPSSIQPPGSRMAWRMVCRRVAADSSWIS